MIGRAPGGIRPLAAATALALLVPLAACGQADGEAGTATTKSAEAGSKTLAEALADAPGLTTISGALSEAGLADVFDGPGSYTILAPDDDAFGALGSQGESLTDPGRRAELVAILRGHILPGHLTPDAIRQAIEQKNGPVTMRNLADGTVTFTADGETITVTNGDNGRATIDGDAMVASNGVVLPISGLIKAPPASATSGAATAE